MSIINYNSMGLLQEKLAKYDLPQQFMAKGVYPYFREIEGKQGTEVEMGGHEVLMFGSNAYTGLTGDERAFQTSMTCMFNWRKSWPLLLERTKLSVFLPVLQ